MTATIEVEKQGDDFQVSVVEGPSRSSHHVTVRPETYDRLTGGTIPAEDLVRESFVFLLEREPKESILGRFDLEIIGRYFPEYEKEIKERLGG